MDPQMVIAIATPITAGGWFAFKVLAWRREEAHRLAAAREAKEARDDAAREAKAAKDDAAREEDRKWRETIVRKIDGLEKAAVKSGTESEKMQAAITAGFREADEKREAGFREADEKREAGFREADEKREAGFREADEKREADRAVLVELKAEMAGFRSSLDSLHRLHREGMEVHRKEIAALGARMGALERKVDRLEEKVDGIERDLASLRAEFVEFREAVMPRARPAGAAA